MIEPPRDGERSSMSEFTQELNAQLANEFGASQQYIAIAVWYDDQTLPLLAAHFYRQAVEARRTEFADPIEPVRLALEQERQVTRQIERLAQLARVEGDLVGEQFLTW